MLNKHIYIYISSTTTSDLPICSCFVWTRYSKSGRHIYRSVKLIIKKLHNWHSCLLNKHIYIYITSTTTSDLPLHPRGVPPSLVINLCNQWTQQHTHVPTSILTSDEIHTNISRRPQCQTNIYIYITSTTTSDLPLHIEGVPPSLVINLCNQWTQQHITTHTCTNVYIN